MRARRRAPSPPSGRRAGNIRAPGPCVPGGVTTGARARRGVGRTLLAVLLGGAFGGPRASLAKRATNAEPTAKPVGSIGEEVRSNR